MDGFNTTAIATFHLFYLTAVCGLSGSLAGASVFISLLIDGFVDPLIGSLSDNWHSRFGRRHPFLFVSIFPLVLTLGLTFSMPRSLTGFWLFVYATVVILIMRIAYSAFSLPFLAMGAELTSEVVVDCRSRRRIGSASPPSRTSACGVWVGFLRACSGGTCACGVESRTTSCVCSACPG